MAEQPATHSSLQTTLPVGSAIPTPVASGGPDETPQPTIARTSLGYVEKSGGQIEEIVLQDSEIQFVHPGECFAGSCRDVKNSPGSGEAINRMTVLAYTDESDSAELTELTASALANPIPTPDTGAWESFPSFAQPATMAKPPEAPQRERQSSLSTLWLPQPESRLGVSARAPILIPALGFVEKADGELDAVVSDQDEVYVVRQGDYFARRYEAVQVSREGVKALRVTPEGTSRSFATAAASPSHDEANCRDGAILAPQDPFCLQSNMRAQGEQRAAETGPILSSHLVAFATRNVRPTERLAAVGRDHGSSSEAKLVSTDTGLFVFQSLGSIEESDGEVEAIIADGSEVRIVKQGDVFAGRYQAVSVNADLVLAVRAHVRDVLYHGMNTSAWTAYNTIHDVSGFSPVNVEGLSEVGVDLFNMSAFAGFDLESHLVAAFPQDGSAGF